MESRHPRVFFKDLPGPFQHAAECEGYFTQKNGFPSRNLALLRPGRRLPGLSRPPGDGSRTHLQAAPEGAGLGAHLVGVLQDAVAQHEGLAPLLHQHVGLGDEEAPGEGVGEAEEEGSGAGSLAALTHPRANRTWDPPATPKTWLDHAGCCLCSRAGSPQPAPHLQAEAPVPTCRPCTPGCGGLSPSGRLCRPPGQGAGEAPPGSARDAQRKLRRVAVGQHTLRR